MKNILIGAALVLLLGVSRCWALSIDATALSSDLNRQAQVNLEHIQDLGPADLEVSGKYSKTEGKPQLYEIGITSGYTHPCGFRLDTDTRYFQSHSTHATGMGYKSGALYFSGGIRTEYGYEAGGRDLYGRVVIGSIRRIGPYFTLAAHLEGLAKSKKNKRLDAKFNLKLQLPAFFYVAVRAQRVKEVKLGGLSLGVTVF